jgi:hypothetical protein
LISSRRFDRNYSAAVIHAGRIFQDYREKHRFQTLFFYFRQPVEFHVDYMVACMQFINIVVHSVEDMNYRIFLQYEFSQLGLDEYLEVRDSNIHGSGWWAALQLLKQNESDQLQVQISAYLDNTFDVGALLEDSEQKNYLQQQTEQLTNQLSSVGPIVAMPGLVCAL